MSTTNPGAGEYAVAAAATAAPRQKAQRRQLGSVSVGHRAAYGSLPAPASAAPKAQVYASAEIAANMGSSAAPKPAEPLPSNSAASKPVESKPAAPKPAELPPAVPKPAELPPAAPKPAEAEPLVLDFPAVEGEEAIPALIVEEGGEEVAAEVAVVAAKPAAAARPQSKVSAAAAASAAASAALAEGHLVDRPTFFHPATGDSTKIQDFALKKSPLGAPPEHNLYRPITARTFDTFIKQNYAQFAPRLLEALVPGFDPAAKVLDRDACKRRNPDKIETFYYQNFVRDYLSRGTPYRGLLVYHGLGSGKTCTSIAAAEALYWGGQKKIFVLTPATLSNNYRKDLGKCGFFPLRPNNFWEFLKVEDVSNPKSLAFYWLTETLGLPPDIIVKQGGGWVPNPMKESNWNTLTPAVKEAIKAQQAAHLEFRFKFIHYNGVMPDVLSVAAEDGVRKGTSMFDDAVVVIDEIHNLVRTVNGTEIGSRPVGNVLKEIEPREFTWTTPLRRERPGFKYPRGYTLYRLLQNAVGMKMVALSATPMINYAQEMAILMNMIGGEQRMAQIVLPKNVSDLARSRAIETWAKKHAEIDFFEITQADNRNYVLNVTPVPFGFSKVVGDNFEQRGFVRQPPSLAGTVLTSRERNMDRWALSLVKTLEAGIPGPPPTPSDSAAAPAPPADIKILAAGAAAEVEAAIATSRAAMTPLKSTNVQLFTYPLLPEEDKEFLAAFVDRTTLTIRNKDTLKSRVAGLVSYYRGGSEELMPRTGLNVVVEVPMSEYQFQEYSRIRMEELEIDMAAPEEEEAGPAVKRKGETTAEADLYAQATQNPSAGFMMGSRAACNFVFPEDVPRPNVSAKDKQKLLGIENGPQRIVAADYVEVIEPVTEIYEGAGPVVAVADEAVVAAAPVAASLTSIIGTLMSGLEAKGDEYLNTGLANFSGKYAAMIANIRKSAGPVLVYSQFKTLEGLGIFAAALRAAPEKFVPLDIRLSASTGQWEIPEILMTEEMIKRPRYIMYTGDQALDKRRLLLQLYNADIANLPPRLAEQCTQLLDAGKGTGPEGPAPDNRDGRVCRVFMITQSGAEGISLFNTRQVHIMEPYWNNVRLQQVIGRAIRLCSHMNLPWDDRVVDVFTYVMAFTARQKAEGAKMMMRADTAQTTDQNILNIAIRKQTLANGLFEIVQTGAVDCELHFHEHGMATQCYHFNKHHFARGDAGRLFTYHPNWIQDVRQAPGGADGGVAAALAAFSRMGPPPNSSAGSSR
jgi:hypothetical protein